MTPEFEKRLEDILEQTPYGWQKAVSHGARWGYQQAISDVLEKLRNKKCKSLITGNYEDSECDCITSNGDAAAWLEKEMRGDKR